MFVAQTPPSAFSHSRSLPRGFPSELQLGLPASGASVGEPPRGPSATSEGGAPSVEEPPPDMLSPDVMSMADTCVLPQLRCYAWLGVWWLLVGVCASATAFVHW